MERQLLLECHRRVIRYTDNTKLVKTNTGKDD